MDRIVSFCNKYTYQLAFGGIFLVYFFNLFIDIMEVDAAQYASIAREMAESGSFLEVFHRGEDYLDKPPLLFWLSALSFQVFGIHNWSFKLPAVLSLIFAVYCTYKYAKVWHSSQIAKNAALILASCQAMMLMSNDIRTDGVLTSSVIFTIWQMSLYLINGHKKQLIWAGVGLALAMMCKGPIAVIIVAAGIGGHLLLTRKWKSIFDINWLLMLLVTTICLLPMCYGLYQQFDLHPEKFVYGLQGPSGLKFFFWTQSFGRITGDIYWSNNTGPFYFTHSILWDFQPFVLFFYGAFIAFVLRHILRNKKAPEYISFMGFLFPFIALSASNYKLPHYIFVLLPFAAVLTAAWLRSLRSPITRILSRFQFVFMHLYFVLGGLSLFFFFPENNIGVIAIWLLGVFTFWMVYKKSKQNKIVLSSSAAAITLGLVMSLSFYPRLLKYQTRTEVGQEMVENKIALDKFYTFGGSPYSLDFYSQRTVPAADTAQVSILPADTYIYTTLKGKNTIDSLAPAAFETVKVLQDYSVTKLSLKFLNPKTRNDKTEETYLLKRKND